MAEKEKTEIKEKKPGFFEAPTGGMSMRRLGAFILIWASIAGSVLGAVFRLDWKSIAVLSAIPLVAAVLLLFFTTWGDVEKVVRAARSKE